MIVLRGRFSGLIYAGAVDLCHGTSFVGLPEILSVLEADGSLVHTQISGSARKIGGGGIVGQQGIDVHDQLSLALQSCRHRITRNRKGETTRRIGGVWKHENGDITTRGAPWK
jgi:hypothetical protein